MKKVILILIFWSCSSQEVLVKNLDYSLVNAIIKKTEEQNLDKTLILELNNNNEYVISILNKLYKYELDNNLHKLDSLKQDLGIIKSLGIIENLKKYGHNDVNQRDSVFDLIFNKKQYEYLISQKHNSQWDINLVDKSFLENADNNSTRTLRIAKPIYTLDKELALIYIDKGTWIGISVYKKVKGKWVSHGLIAPAFVQPKVEKFEYD